jgi:hypothetical protein
MTVTLDTILFPIALIAGAWLIGQAIITGCEYIGDVVHHCFCPGDGEE